MGRCVRRHENDSCALLLVFSTRYATQPELKSVPLKIITSMSVVPDKVSRDSIN